MSILGVSYLSHWYLGSGVLPPPLQSKHYQSFICNWGLNKIPPITGNCYQYQLSSITHHKDLFCITELSCGSSRAFSIHACFASLLPLDSCVPAIPPSLFTLALLECNVNAALSTSLIQFSCAESDSAKFKSHQFI